MRRSLGGHRTHCRDCVCPLESVPRGLSVPNLTKAQIKHSKEVTYCSYLDLDTGTPTLPFFSPNTAFYETLSGCGCVSTMRSLSLCLCASISNISSRGQSVPEMTPSIEFSVWSIAFGGLFARWKICIWPLEFCSLNILKVLSNRCILRH